MGPEPHGCQYYWSVVLYACTVVREDANKETRLFGHIFIFGGILNGGNPGSVGPPTGYAYDCNFNPICDIKILRVFCLFALVCMSTRH